MTNPTALTNSSLRSLPAKVPQITALFWVIKVLSTGMGETFSDFLVKHLNPALAVGGALTAFVVALVVQFRSPRYQVWTYWTAVVMVAIFGTMVADIVDFVIGIPLAVSSLVFAALLAGVLALWYRTEGTLDVHTINTRRREGFYWTTVVVTFALGTVLGDFTAAALHLGYLLSTVLFAVAIAVPALSWRYAGLNPVIAFWAAYVVTRPLGASITDWLASDRSDGLHLGTGWVTLAATIPMLALIATLARRRDTA
ncbi:COG4705 family protein [Nocardia sp. NPDC004722]